MTEHIPQQLVVYTDTSGREVVFDTAYNYQQSREVIGLCKRLHGEDSKPRVRNSSST